MFLIFKENNRMPRKVKKYFKRAILFCILPKYDFHDPLIRFLFFLLACNLHRLFTTNNIAHPNTIAHRINCYD